MNWPVFDAENAFYLDIGRYFVEKHGLYLNRYARWTNLENSSGHKLSFNLIFVVAFIVTALIES